MPKVRIALIDSGVGKYQSDLYRNAYTLTPDGNIFDQYGHGCAILYILKKYCNAEIDVYKIVGDSGEIDEDILINVLKKLLEDNEVSLINISMGITLSEKHREMELLCTQLINKGVIIVSAFDNDGAVSYPAALDSVIGVDVSSRCHLLHEYEYIESGIVNIRGFNGVQRLPLPDGSFTTFSGTSFVAPLITAKIAGFMEAGIATLDGIKQALQKEATYTRKAKHETIYEKCFSINKAVIFPVNKEMHAILANQDLLTFRIHQVCDVKYFGSVGKSISELLGTKLENDLTIIDIDHLDWNGDFDSIILGHNREMSQALHVDFSRKIFDKCKEYNKKIYAFDDLRNLEEVLDPNWIYFPHVEECHVPQNQFGKLHTLSCPVIGVFGTSSRQGKFTLQLKLRRQFIKNGYKIAQLGTEPTALLFGMDDVYPMGYDGVCLNDGNRAILMINKQLQQMVTEETAAVLVGSQSQTTAYSGNNLCMIPLNSMYLLLASQPDVVVLCVNTYDDDTYIARTIKLIEGLVDTEVIALVISPVQRSLNTALNRKTQLVDRETLSEFQQHLNHCFNIPTFLMDFEWDAAELFDHCIDVLSNE